MKKFFKDSLVGFADRMQECFEGVGLDMKYSLNKCHETYSDLSAKIDEKFKENERPAPSDGSNVPSKPNHVPEDAQKKVNKEEVSPVYEERDVSKEKKKKVVVRKSRRPKLTWVGTSISNALDKDKLEKDLNVDLTVVKAYCIEEEGRLYQILLKMKILILWCFKLAALRSQILTQTRLQWIQIKI